MNRRVMAWAALWAAVAMTCALVPSAWAQPSETPAGAEAATTKPTSQAASRPADKPIQGMYEEWLTKMRAGGQTMWALLALSVVGVMFALERIFMLRRGRIVPRGLAEQADRLWRQGKQDQLLALCRRNKSTLARVLAFVAEHRTAPVADISTAAGDIASRELRRHLLRAYPLAIVATLAPLLGLLGTVIGMIDAFDTVVMVGMGDATALAGGISKALITTMAGLTIAIPALFAYHLFKSRTSLFGVMLEEEVTELISAWRMGKED